MSTQSKTSNNTIVDLVNTYINLEVNTALVLATGETDCTELIITDNDRSIEDIQVIYDAIALLTAGDYHHSKVMAIEDRYIVHNYEIISLAHRRIQVVDE